MSSCTHDPYWKTLYDNCMACRAEQAETEHRALADRLAQMEQNYRGVCGEANSCADLYDRESKLRADLQQQLHDAQATIARLTQEREGLDVRVDSLRKHLSSTITERNQLEQQVARLREFAEYMKTKRREQWARWADEAEDPVSTDDEIEKLDEQFREACKALRETGA